MVHTIPNENVQQYDEGVQREQKPQKGQNHGRHTIRRYKVVSLIEL